jgi:hypothetical protein
MSTDEGGEGRGIALSKIITEISYSQIRSFCEVMATNRISDEKEVAFSFVYDAVDVTELEESGDDVSTEFYYDCEAAYRQVLTVQLLSSALNSPDDFHEVGEEDKAYDWCIGRLLTAFPFKSEKDFSSFIDALGDDYE